MDLGFAVHRLCSVEGDFRVCGIWGGLGFRVGFRFLRYRVLEFRATKNNPSACVCRYTVTSPKAVGAVASAAATSPLPATAFLVCPPCVWNCFKQQRLLLFRRIVVPSKLKKGRKSAQGRKSAKPSHSSLACTHASPTPALHGALPWLMANPLNVLLLLPLREAHRAKVHWFPKVLKP